MITITVPGKATQQHCEWLRPRGLEGCTIQVPPVVNLRHSEVVSRQYSRKKRMMACIRPRIALFHVHCLVFFSPEKTLWRNVVDGVLCCCCGP